MAKNGEAEGFFAVSVAKKAAMGTIFLVLARHESNVEMGKLSETLSGAVGFGWRLGAHCREGVTSQVSFSVQGGYSRHNSREMCAQVPALAKSMIVRPYR